MHFSSHGRRDEAIGPAVELDCAGLTDVVDVRFAAHEQEGQLLIERPD
jgi:hypothetical protein